ncbi:MAG TPA: hypothetical protein VNM37_28460 [Candidatus Dormibacteraeota bacterium]|nr:hypothetical protein [Candidatus Dormibacteraeota bacterium]
MNFIAVLEIDAAIAARLLREASGGGWGAELNVQFKVLEILKSFDGTTARGDLERAIRNRPQNRPEPNRGGHPLHGIGSVE